MVLKSKLIFLFLFISFYVVGQSDTIIVYNVETGTADEIFPVSYDSSVTFDKTTSSVGSMGDQVALDLEPPVYNLYDGTEFSKIERAALYFDITDYPIRTAIRLFRYYNDTLGGCCSGMLISKNLVLTAAHCIRNYDSETWRGDSTFITTGFDNGVFHPILPGSIVKKYYIFKSYYSHTSLSNDFALLELKYPIGEQTGWVGMAFSTDTSYYSDKVFHKLSYPYDASAIDTSIKVNGDTLYYNYGKIDVLYPPALTPIEIGLKSSEARLIPGQSGSSLFYTDNIEYFSVGIATYSTFYRHFAITNNIFYQFKNIIENYASHISYDLTEENNVIVYPNPFSNYTTVEFDNPQHLKHTLTIINTSGQIVKCFSNITSTQLKVDRENLPCGLYIYKLSNDENVVSIGKLVIK